MSTTPPRLRWGYRRPTHLESYRTGFCVIVPSDREASMKKVAAVFGGKSAEMLAPADAERLTGYKIGGVSPFGQRRKLPTVIEAECLLEPYVYVNGGQRGLQLRMTPVVVREVTEAIPAAVSA
jgi:Cys-tRNA(Pro)/Cys-tRNA(Cys) deacylase